MAASKKARASVILTWLILDYEHREMILERNQTLDEREEWDMSGLSVVAADASSSIYVITAVGSDSPAKRAGIQSNDTLVEIDGRPVRQWMLSALRGHLRQEGHRCSLVLERAGQRYAVLIQLERRI